MKVFALNYPELIDDLMFMKLFKNASNEKQEIVKKFSRPDDAKRVLVGDILLRSIIASELKVSRKIIEFNTNKYGKPYLKRNCGLHFNVSHSEDWIVCAVDNEPIGIDIEKIRPVELETAAQFFSEEEFKMLMAKNPEDRQHFFFDLWTLKESYIKAIGKGLSMPLNLFTISFLKDSEIAVKSSNRLTNWALKQYNLDSEYKLSVCCAHKNFPDNLILKTLENIFPE